MALPTTEFTFAFFLVLIRTSTMLVSAPLLANRGIPAMTRIGLAVFLALVLVPLNAATLPPAPQQIATVADAAFREALFGLVLGLSMNLVFLSLQMASRIIGVQIGFGLGGVLDPITGTDSGVFDQFYVLLVSLVFFATNAHYLVIGALAETTRAVPLGTFDPFAPTAFRAEAVAAFALGLMVTAVRVAMPIMAALFLVDLGMGFVARTAPQVQVLIVAMPIKIGVGLVVLMAALPASSHLMQNVFAGPLTGSSEILLGAG